MTTEPGGKNAKHQRAYRQRKKHEVEQLQSRLRESEKERLQLAQNLVTKENERLLLLHELTRQNREEKRPILTEVLDNEIQRLWDRLSEEQQMEHVMACY